MNKIKHDNLMVVSELLKAILAGFLAMFGIWDDCGGAVERGRLEAKND